MPGKPSAVLWSRLKLPVGGFHDSVVLDRTFFTASVSAALLDLFGKSLFVCPAPPPTPEVCRIYDDSGQGCFSSTFCPQSPACAWPTEGAHSLSVS